MPPAHRERQRVEGSLTLLGREKPQGAFVPQTRALRCLPRLLIPFPMKAAPPDLFSRESEELLAKNEEGCPCVNTRFGEGQALPLQNLAVANQGISRFY